MKKSFFNLSLILLTALSFTACKKDTPTFEEKITGEWHSVNVKLNGADVTNYFTLDLELQADRDFRGTLKTVDIFSGKTTTTNPRGTWEADAGDQEVELIYDDTNESELYEVLDVTDTEMSVKTVQDNDTIEIVFEKVQ